MAHGNYHELAERNSLSRGTPIHRQQRLAWLSILTTDKLAFCYSHTSLSACTMSTPSYSVYSCPSHWPSIQGSSHLPARGKHKVQAIADFFSEESTQQPRPWCLPSGLTNRSQRS